VHEKQIVEGMRVTVLLNPKAKKEARTFVEGHVVYMADGGEGVRYRVKHKCKWGMTSGWYPLSHIL